MAPPRLITSLLLCVLDLLREHTVCGGGVDEEQESGFSHCVTRGFAEPDHDAATNRTGSGVRRTRPRCCDESKTMHTVQCFDQARGLARIPAGSAEVVISMSKEMPQRAPELGKKSPGCPRALTRGLERG